MLGVVEALIEGVRFLDVPQMPFADMDRVVPELAEDLRQRDLPRGKPFAFGNILGTPFLGLPGNPVSVFVTLLIIGRPYLFACQGITDTGVVPSLQLANFSKKGSSREDYLRVKSTVDGVQIFSSQSSGILMSTTWGDGLVRQRPGQDIEQGDLLDYFPYLSMM